MRTFGFPQAQHYCSGGGSTPSHDFRQLSSTLTAGTLITEGTPQFAEYRDSALQDAERLLFFGVSHYRRALDLMIPSSAPWAEITCYYGAFFAASAILHMFGCAVLFKAIVEVDKSSLGSQQLAVRDKSRQGLSRGGSHQKFWQLFYRAAKPLIPLVEPGLRFALVPIGSATTLIDQRNAVNYDSAHALNSASQFMAAFDPDLFPTSLPASLGTQYQVTEALLEIGFSFGDGVGLGASPPGACREFCGGEVRAVGNDTAGPGCHFGGVARTTTPTPLEEETTRRKAARGRRASGRDSGAGRQPRDRSRRR